jgi:hypothetical protein
MRTKYGKATWSLTDGRRAGVTTRPRTQSIRETKRFCQLRDQRWPQRSDITDTVKRRTQSDRHNWLQTCILSDISNLRKHQSENHPIDVVRPTQSESDVPSRTQFTYIKYSVFILKCILVPAWSAVLHARLGSTAVNRLASLAALRLR